MTEEREILADHENRISFLENSLPGSAMSYNPEEHPSLQQQIDDIKRQLNDIRTKEFAYKKLRELEAVITHVHKDLHELQSRRITKGGKYKQYA